MQDLMERSTSTDVLHVVIDERKRLTSLDDLRWLHNARTHVVSKSNVFKDYILSTEAFAVPGVKN